MHPLEPPADHPDRAAQDAVPRRTSSRPADIDGYIRQGWRALRRSAMSPEACRDSKVSGRPTLYLPHGLPVPADVSRRVEARGVQVRHLPRPVRRLGDVCPSELDPAGLLYLPHPYVVPGGMFNEMYGWDSYFIVRGLLEDAEAGLAQGMVDNWGFQIAHYGGILNANRTYYLTRTQPPFLTSAVRAVFAHTADREWLARAYAWARRDHALWTSPPFLAGETGLSRYFDAGDGPIPEMAHHPGYYEDVAAWLLDHPTAPAWVQRVENDAASDLPVLDVRRADDDASSKPVRVVLTADFYRGDRAMRASGFDVSFRFGPFSGATHHHAPICLNALLYKAERDLAAMARLLGEDDSPWEAAAWQRARAVRRYLWDADAATFFDYDVRAQRTSGYVCAAMAFPLWAGLATQAEARGVARALTALETDHGLVASATESGAQWDAPYGWAPLHLIAVEGLLRHGEHAQALRLARRFNRTVLQGFLRDGTIREKYDMAKGSCESRIAIGYTENVVGFGWTNAVYRLFEALLR